jgi:hypothetical protein
MQRRKGCRASRTGTPLALIALAALLQGSAVAGESPVKGTIRHAFILSDSGRGKVLKYDAEGKLVWECDAPNSYDCCVAPNGNVVFTCRIQGGNHGVREVTPEKKVVWEYKTAGEVFACQRLADGNTLVGECASARLVEVSPEGKIAREIKVKVQHGGHGAMRVARKTKAGTYIVGHPGDGMVREYSATGEVLREIKAPGPAYGAQRLDNGNVVFSCEHFVIEVDPEGKEVWRLSDKEVPEVGPKWLACIARLANGNTVVGNWLGHGQEGKGVPLFEVTPDKKVVWQFTDTATTRNVAGFAILDGE